MNGKRRWLGWVAIALGAVALAVALLGGRFGPQMGAAGPPGANMQQQSAQSQNAQPQNGPGMNAQPGAQSQNAQPQNGPGAQSQNAQPQNGPSTNAQPSAGQQSNRRQGGTGAGRQNAQPGAQSQNAQPQNGPAGPGGDARRAGGRQNGGFGLGGLRFPLRLFGGSFQWVMLALLIGLGVWMIRGRNTVATSTSGRTEPAQAPAQAPISPTGEAYTEEPSEEE